MEIEMKYSIPGKEIADAIWDDEYIAEVSDLSSKETVHMKSAYFDTEDKILSEHDVAFRVRMEGSKIVASLKWNGSSEDGLHRHEEVNVPIDEPTCFLDPSSDIFKESEQGTHMLELVGDKRLHSILEMNFIRRRVRIDYEESIMELAIDTGEILTEKGEIPICELEIELFSGEEDDVKKLGKVMSEKYMLEPLNISKYARGLRLK